MDDRAEKYGEVDGSWRVVGERGSCLLFSFSAPQAVQYIQQLLKFQWGPVMLSCRYLTYFKKVIRDQSVFEDNQVDPAALEVCLASVAPQKDASQDVEEEGDEVHARV